ncbi:MAG: helix-turn-helix domain-containing protein [Weeksellaceae bacterium]|jgi:hypothetical protein|nr:helix-turn-helix domain-containing protein [Weeksellaceae bacterium]
MKKPPKLLQEIAALLNNFSLQISRQITLPKQKVHWLHGSDVKRILNISDSTLWRMRKDNKIPYVKIGRTNFYPKVFFDKIAFKEAMKNYNGNWDKEGLLP